MNRIVAMISRQPSTFRPCTALVALWMVLALSACGGPQERKAQYRAKAQDYIQAGNFSKARVALRNVLKIDPKDADAYFLVAQVEEKEKNWRNAVANYQQVIDIVPDHKDALIVLAKYYLEAKLTDEVKRAADKVLENRPQDPQAEALKIAILAQQDQISQALARAEDLSRRHPTEPDAAILLGTLYGHQRRYREAQATLQRAIQAHPHHLDLLNNLRTILDQAHDDRATEQVLRQIIQEEPTIYDHRLKLARFHDQRHALDKAESVLREAVQVFPGLEQAWLTLCDFLSLRRGQAVAEAGFREAMSRLPYSTQIPFALGALYERHKDVSKARVVYETLAKEHEKKPAGLDARVKIAQLDFNAGRQADAERRLAEVLRDNPRSAEGLVLQGKMALIGKNSKDAVQAFRTVLRDQPEFAHVQYLLGQAYIMTGEPQLARESFERAVALQPDAVEPGLALAMVESQSGQAQRARARLLEILKTHPDYLPALERLFAMDLAAGEWSHAKTVLNSLRRAMGHSTVLLMAEGRLYEAQRDYAKAVRAFEQAASMAPAAPDPLMALVRLDLTQNQIERARRRLETIVNAQPSHAYAHGMLAEVWGILGQLDVAAAQYREATRLNPAWVTPWLNWASLLQAQQPDAAIRILEEGIAVNASSEELHMLLASVFADQGLIDEAIAAYETVLRMNPRNILSANNLATLLADHKQDAPHLERAFLLSREFEKQAPHPLFLDTVGWVRLRMGHIEEALRLIRQAVAKAPDMPTLNYHFGSALYQSGQKGEAKVYLTKALKSKVSFQGRREAEQLLARASG
ncbi:MAG: tetratricopeptide repeat protein [Nitrospira sp.]|nr:tetratricopeptide repeat protein [Nitrospira sp.]